MEPNTQEIKNAKEAGLEQFKGGEKHIETPKIEGLDSAETALPKPEGSLDGELNQAPTEAVEEPPQDETANSVSSIIESGLDNVAPLSSEADKAAAINEVIFKPSSEFNPFEATDIANGESISSEE